MIVFFLQFKLFRQCLRKSLNLKVLIDYGNHLIVFVSFDESNVLQVIGAHLLIVINNLLIELVDGYRKALFIDGKNLFHLVGGLVVAFPLASPVHELSLMNVTNSLSHKNFNRRFYNFGWLILEHSGEILRDFFYDRFLLETAYVNVTCVTFEQ